jgi:hypothetical protein
LEQLFETYRSLYYALAQYLTAFCLVEEAQHGYFCSLLTCSVTLRQVRIPAAIDSFSVRFCD